MEGTLGLLAPCLLCFLSAKVGNTELQGKDQNERCCPPYYGWSWPVYRHLAIVLIRVAG